MGKLTAQKDTIIDITSDSQVNSNFPYRWETGRNSSLVLHDRLRLVWFIIIYILSLFVVFGSLVVLDVVFLYLSLFLVYINMKKGNNRCLMLD